MRLLLALSILIPLTSHGQVTIQNGRTLSELIDNLYGGNGIQLKDTGHQAHFGESEDFQRFSRTLQAVLQSRSVVPVPSAVGLVSYRFNEATGTYERKEGSLGPILSERGLTTGKGNLNVSTTYTFADFNQIEGRETVDLTLRHCLLERCVSNIASPFLKDTIDVQMRLRLKSQALAISAVYGMTDRLDVGIVVPYIRNDLSVFTHATIRPNPEATSATPHEFDLDIETPDQAGTATAIGIGDIIARAKLRVLQQSGIDAAVMADVAFPTGDKENLLGTGRMRIKTIFIASKEVRRFTPHVNVGYEARVGDTKLDIVDYRLGTEIMARPNLTLAADLIGIVRPHGTESFRTEALEDQELVGRSEIDGVLGGKWKVAPNRAFIFNFLFPLNTSGIRPGMVMTAGLQFGL